MPKKPKHEATDAMYLAWRDARPAVPIPFSVKIKGQKVTQTWSEIKDRMNRDATSYALAFCTSHLAPSTAQANVLQELAQQDEKLFRKNRQAEDAREAARQQSTSSGGGNVTASTSAARSVSRGAAAASSTTGKREWLSEVERETLEQSEGGGRGRVAFLKERNKLPLNVRYGGMPRTSSQQYGFAQLNNEHLPELRDYVAHVQATNKGVSLPELQRRPPQHGTKFVSEFVPAEVARQSQIPPEYAALTARPGKTCPYALSIIDGPGSAVAIAEQQQQWQSLGGGGGGGGIMDAEALVAASSQEAREKRQSEQHRHARGDFRKRTFTANTKATGIFESKEWV